MVVVGCGYFGLFGVVVAIWMEGFVPGDIGGDNGYHLVIIILSIDGDGHGTFEHRV